MKKLALITLLSLTATALIAMSDIEYGQAIQKAKSKDIEWLMGGPNAASQEAASLVVENNINEWTSTPNDALIFFSKRANLPAVVYLVEKRGANPNYTDNHGFTPVSASEFTEHGKEIADYLISKGAILEAR